MSQAKAPALPAVWNIPHGRRSTTFTGRANELDRLRQGFVRRIPYNPVQAIHGLGGIGKTQLALEYAYRFAGEYDVVWWLRADEPATLAADFADLAVALGLPVVVEPDQRAAVEAVKHWLGRNDRWLLVFDSAREPQDVAAYMPVNVRGNVLATSRHAAWAGVALPLQLKGLSRRDSIELLLARVGAGEDQEPDARELAASLGDLPLALAQAGAYIEETGTTIAEYLKRFRERHAELLRRGAEGDTAPTVATAWDISFRDAQAHSPAAGELLDLCAFLGADDIPRNALYLGAAGFPPALAAAVGDDFALDEAIKALRRYSLVDAHDEGLSVHRLVQTMVRDRLDEAERRAWAERAVVFVSDIFPEEPGDPAVRAACRRWLPHARAALASAQAAHVPPGEPAERLLRHAAKYQHVFGFDRPAREMLEQALKLAEDLHGPTHPHVAMTLTSLGEVLMRMNDLTGALACAERALAIDEENLGSVHPYVATDAGNLAAVLKEHGRLAEARDLAERALAIDEALGPDDAAVARDLNNLGAILRVEGDLARARSCFERAIGIDELVRPDDRPLHLNNLSLLLREMAELDARMNDAMSAKTKLEKAQELAERALAIGEETFGADNPQVATFHSNLASALQDRAQLRDQKQQLLLPLEDRKAVLLAARKHLERALEIGIHIYGSDHYVVAIRRNNLGLLLMDAGDLRGALIELENAVEIAKTALGPGHRRVKRLENNRDAIRRRLASHASSSSTPRGTPKA